MLQTKETYEVTKKDFPMKKLIVTLRIGMYVGVKSNMPNFWISKRVFIKYKSNRLSILGSVQLPRLMMYV